MTKKQIEKLFDHLINIIRIDELTGFLVVALLMCYVLSMPSPVPVNVN